MRNLRPLLWLLLPAVLGLSPTRAQGQEVRLAPGEYITEKGWGTLTLRQGGGRLSFVIEAVGANGHSCSLEGEVVKGRATLETDEETGPCRVSFKPLAEGAEGGKGIEVASEEGEACRYFCGMRADFQGFYLVPPPGCAPAARETARTEFKRLYDKKAYPQALAKLEPVLKSCARMVGWIEEGWIRNDLAITLLKTGDLAGCRRLLEPLAADAARTDEELREEYPPSDADNYLPVVKAARTNLKLCKAPGR
jgi:hypothetical protein